MALIGVAMACAGGSAPGAPTGMAAPAVTATGPHATSASSVEAPAAEPPAASQVIGPGNLDQVTALHNYWIDTSFGLGLSGDFHRDLDAGKSAVAYSPDGRFVAVAGCQTFHPEADREEYTCGAVIFVAMSKPFLAILDAASGSLQASVPIEKYTFAQSMAFTHDGNKLVFATEPGKVAVWDIASAKIERVLGKIAENELVNELEISPDDRWAALKVTYGFKNTGSVRVWDLASGDLVLDTPIGTSKSRIPEEYSYYDLGSMGWGPHFSADSQRLLISSDDAFSTYDTDAWNEIGRASIPCDIACDLEASPDLSLLIVLEIASADPDQKPKSVGVWDLRTGEKIREIGEDLDFPDPMTFTPDGRFLLAGTGVGWDVANDWQLINVKQAVRGNQGEFIKYRKFADDGRTYLIWRGEEDVTLEGLPGSGGSPDAASAPVQGEFELPKGKILLEIATADTGEFIRYDVLSLPGGTSEPYPFEQVEGTAYRDPSADFRYWALTQVIGEGPDQHWALYLLDPNAGDPVLISEGDQIDGVAWSADSRYLAFAGFSTGLHLYDIQTGRTVQIPVKVSDRLLMGAPDWLQPAFSRSGDRIAVGSLAGMAILNRDGSAARLVYDMPFSPYPHFEWHPDGRRIFFEDALFAARTNVFGVLLDSGKVELLSDDLDDARYLRLSPDGRFLAFEEGYETIRIQAVEEKGTRPLYRTPGRYPVWSPDGKYLAYTSGDRYEYVSVLNMQTGQEMRVYEIRENAGYLAGWLP